MADDLNTPKSFAELHRVARALSATSDPAEISRLKGVLLACGDLLGLLQQTPEAWFGGAVSEDDAERIEALIQERKAARQAKDYAGADRIRDQLAAEGIELKDGPDGTTWQRTG